MPENSSRPSASPPPAELDEVNRRLLAALTADARISMTELARRVGMSAPAVTERVARLDRAGVIDGFHVRVDPAALGYPVLAIVLIRATPGQIARITSIARATFQVSECYRITGEDSLMLKVHAPSVDRLQEILDRFARYGETRTSIVVGAPVPPRPLPVAEYREPGGPQDEGRGPGPVREIGPG